MLNGKWFKTLFQSCRKMRKKGGPKKANMNFFPVVTYLIIAIAAWFYPVNGEVAG